MTESLSSDRRPGGHDGWTALSRDTLQLIAEGVTETAGFGVAAIQVARDDGYLHVAAVAGNDDARRTLEGHRTLITDLLDELAKGDDWGMLKFVPHERLDLDDHEWGWIPDIEPSDDPEAWHPLDLLVAPLRDAGGVLRGALTIDLPDDGRRPSPAQRRLLNRFAAQAGRAVLTTLEREELAEQVRLANAARLIIGRASAQRTLDRILADACVTLVEGLRAGGSWIHTFDSDGHILGRLHAYNGLEVVLPDEFITVAQRAARLAWEDQESRVMARGRIPIPAGVSVAQAEAIFDYLDSIDVGSILFVPIGVADECLGNIVLTRPRSAPEWSETEASAALDIGRDLGTSILNARAFEREHQLVRELRELDSYKSQLIATVSHELKNPLTSIQGHLEILEGVEVDDAVRTSLNAIDRGAKRMGRVVEDLLLLSKVGDPTVRLTQDPVDMGAVVADVADLVSVSADLGGLVLDVDTPAEPALVRGDADVLDRVVVNLVSNAVKYTPPGGRVHVRVRRRGEEVVLTCADDGLGISEADQARLFDEFFRSTNAEALAKPGTGLGLAIVRRIVDRHHGRIEVESELGKGSTFRVFLPAA